MTDCGPYTYDKWWAQDYNITISPPVPSVTVWSLRHCFVLRSQHALGNDVVSEPSALPRRFRTLFIAACHEFSQPFSCIASISYTFRCVSDVFSVSVASLVRKCASLTFSSVLITSAFLFFFRGPEPSESTPKGSTRHTNLPRLSMEKHLRRMKSLGPALSLS